MTLKKLLDKIPGLILLVAIGLLGRQCELTYTALAKLHHWRLPKIEGIIWDILLAAIAINLLAWLSPRAMETYRAHCKSGVDSYKFFLGVGIAFLGARFLFTALLKLGVQGFALLPLTFASTAVIFILLGKLFKLSSKQITLLFIGSGICGASAIAATAPAIDASDEEQSTSMGAIVIMGAMSIIIFPMVGHFLHLSNGFFGLWAGFGVDNTAEVAATGMIFSAAAGQLAIITKSARNACIGPVALGCSIYYSRKGMAKGIEGNKLWFLLKKIPWFVPAMLIVSALASAKVFSPAQIGEMANFSVWMFWLMFAGLGLSLNLSEMSKKGLKALAVGVLGELCSAIAVFAIVFGWMTILGAKIFAS